MKFRAELVWNREFDFVPHGRLWDRLDDAISYAKGLEEMGDGACVKKVRVVDDEGRVRYANGRKVRVTETEKETDK